MESKEFFGKFKSKYLWGNLLAMALTVVLLCVGVKYGLDIYTHHGEGVPVPNLTGMTFNNAANLLDRNGLRIVVSDSGYNKRLPADCILAQSPGEGTSVKKGHTIYVTVNSPSSPTVTIPDIIDNSSVREATAKLTALGFKLLDPKIVTGEKDWVYGILCRGRRISAGDRVKKHAGDGESFFHILHLSRHRDRTAFPPPPEKHEIQPEAERPPALPAGFPDHSD